MDFTRSHAANHNLNHIQDSSFFENGPSSVNTTSRHCDFQVVPGDDVFDSILRNENDISNTSTYGPCYKANVPLPNNLGLIAQLDSNNDDVFNPVWKNEESIPHSTLSRNCVVDAPCDEVKLTTSQFNSNLLAQLGTATTTHLSTSTRKESDSDSLDVYLKPCVISPTKLEDLYSTLENQDDDVFQFPPKNPHQFSDQLVRLRTPIQNIQFSLRNADRAIEQNNTDDNNIDCHDNVDTGQICQGRAAVDAAVQHSEQHLTLSNNVEQDIHLCMQTLKQDQGYTSAMRTALQSHESEQYTSLTGTVSSDCISSDEHNSNLTDRNQNIYHPLTSEPTFHHQYSRDNSKEHAQWFVNTSTDKNIDMAGTSAAESRDLKAFHNVTEKQRRNQMKTRFENLRKVIPKVERLPKAPKIMILRKAKECIIYLEKEEKKLEALRKTLKMKNKQLLEKLQSILK